MVMQPRNTPKHLRRQSKMKNYEAPDMLKYSFSLESDIANASQGGGGDVLEDDDFDEE